MKKTFLILATIILALTACASPKADSIRTINGFVSGIDAEYIYVDTEDGNGWVIDYENGYTVGDDVTITFDTLGNDDLYDDEIISIEVNVL